MADIADVEIALQTLITPAIYPNGPSNPSAILPPDNTNPPCRIFPGWPKAEAIDLDVAGQILVNGVPVSNGVGPVVNVSIFNPQGMGRNTTRWWPRWVDATKATPTITWTQAIVGNGTNIAFGGTITAGNYIAVIVGGAAFAYQIQENDSYASIASALAALIATKYPAFQEGATAGGTLTIVGRDDVTVRAAAPGTVLQALAQKTHRIHVTVWAPTPASRAATAELILPLVTGKSADALTPATGLFLTMPDQSAARVVYCDDFDLDEQERVDIFRREILLDIEFSTTNTAPGYPIIAPVSQVGVLGQPAIPPYSTTS